MSRMSVNGVHLRKRQAIRNKDKNPKLPKDLERDFRTMISESISRENLSPNAEMTYDLTDRAPEVAPKAITGSDASKVGDSKGRLRTSKLAGEWFPTFKLPSDCVVIEKGDMDELPQLDEGQRGFIIPVPVRGLSFSERMQNWRIQRRMRKNEKSYDMAYRHLRSKKSFRSMKEVIDFLLFDILPPSNNKKRKRVALEIDLNKETTDVPE